jgi:dTDP-4-dehydrorhamnose reductase
LRVAILGAGGMLGSDLVPILETEHQVIAFGRGSLDITDAAGTLSGLRGAVPEVVINCAAATDVDRCEREPGWAHRLNAEGARNVAVACGAVGARLIHISTDFVFSGNLDRAYDETDQVDPINVYGASKLAGEREVLEHCPGATIVRTQWLYGRHGRSFPRAILTRAKTRPEAGLRVVSDQTGAPTWTVDLARKLAWLVENPLTGIVHINNAGECNRHEWAVELLRVAGLGDVNVGECASSDFKTDAHRPKHSTLRRMALERAGADDMPDWRDGVAGFVAELRSAGEL